AYTSPSYRPAVPRWRILFPLSAELPPSERFRLCSRANGIFDGALAPESWSLSQAYFFGAVAGNPHHRVELVEGTMCLDQADELDLDAIGKPSGSSAGGANGSGGPVNVAELEAAIVNGKSYHVPCARLAGLWARHGVALLDAYARLDQLFDNVFPADRDA